MWALSWPSLIWVRCGHCTCPVFDHFFPASLDVYSYLIFEYSCASVACLCLHNSMCANMTFQGWKVIYSDLNCSMERWKSEGNSWSHKVSAPLLVQLWSHISCFICSLPTLPTWGRLSCDKLRFWKVCQRKQLRLLSQKYFDSNNLKACLCRACCCKSLQVLHVNNCKGRNTMTCWCHCLPFITTC